jgi:hypothetical protein
LLQRSAFLGRNKVVGREERVEARARQSVIARDGRMLFCRRRRHFVVQSRKQMQA